ncbi:hypothetical protein FF124_09155 [Martelella lutilitoris]|uniref:Uncharacterized protein n=1 Tax=Martelella lutilitoris TaxID=2583532 RepID=A0A5C4JV27_9HYPH|nr:hypothetical protein [Martelella lutilitoris]TNB48479.1 hypothetical protein FF124_09155 [Martelella lutilitoris]
MQRMRMTAWIAFAIAVCIYGAMTVWTLPAISQAAGGLMPFDMRPGGYSRGEAQAFLAALSPQGRAIYLGPQQRLDLVYPAALALTLGIALYLLAPFNRFWKGLLAMIPVLGMVFDYLENAAVRAMLLVGPSGLQPGQVETASLLTTAKVIFDSAGYGLVLVFLILWALRRWRRVSAPQA